MRRTLLLALILLISQRQAALADPQPTAPVPQSTFHLTPGPWKPEVVPPAAYLDVAEPLAWAMAKLQNDKGLIIDPYEHREIQYSTAYFAYGVAALVKAGRAKELLPRGLAAMDCATDQFSRGGDAIDNHAGEFVIAPLTLALPLYRDAGAPPEKVAQWTQRLSRPLKGTLRGLPNNWQAYAMRGEWLRALAGFEKKDLAQQFIESAWTGGQSERLSRDPWALYHDDSSDPDALAVDPVGRDNLMGLVLAGYDGPSAKQMKELLTKGAYSSLFLQDPTGQSPGGGRSSGHVWNDLVTLISNEQMAQLSLASKDVDAAGRYQRAADLAFASLRRWQRDDGSFWVTKNRFDPALRVGYSQASFFTNYNAALLFHLMEAYEARRNQPAIQERPAPAEVGGYALATDPAFASIVADAGGMFLQGFLRGSTQVEKNQYWTTLGITRFGRSGWDSRLGAVEAIRDARNGVGVSFAPTFLESGKWVRLCDAADRYEGQIKVDLATPLLVRFSITYAPRIGKDGPRFHQSFIVTPEGVLSNLSADGASDGNFGFTLPLFESEGVNLTKITAGGGIASTRFADVEDELAYIALKPDGSADTQAKFDRSEPDARGSYGDVRPVRWIGRSVFVYPRGPRDPAAADVARSVQAHGEDFSSVLERVEGDVYVGRTAAGGMSESIHLGRADRPAATFSERTGFILTFNGAKKGTGVESDRNVSLQIDGKSLMLKAFLPAQLAN